MTLCLCPEKDESMFFKTCDGGIQKMQHPRLRHMISVINSDSLFNDEVLSLSECREHHPCPAYPQLNSIQRDLKNMPDKTTVSPLTEGLGEGLTILKPNRIYHSITDNPF